MFSSVSSPGNGPSSQGNVNTRDPRQSTKTDPRLARMSSDPRLAQQQGNSPTVAQSSPPQRPPPRPIVKDLPEIDGSVATQTKTGCRVLYILHTCEANITHGKIPPHIDINSEKYKDDPRVLKALNKLEPKKSKIGSKASQSPSSLSKSATVGPPGSGSKVDPRMQRTLSAPSGAPMGPPSMPDALRERPLVNRRLSTDNVVTSPPPTAAPPTAAPVTVTAGSQSPSAKDKDTKQPVQKTYRNDPRFRKKKMSGDDIHHESDDSDKARTSPVCDSSKDSSKDKDPESAPKGVRRGMDYASPLGAMDDKAPNSQSSVFGFYNKPPNEKFHEHMRSGHRTDSDGKKDRCSPNINDSTLGSSLMPLLPENMQQPPTSAMNIVPTSTSLLSLSGQSSAELSSMRDVFKTLDPTASPFC